MNFFTNDVNTNNSRQTLTTEIYLQRIIIKYTVFIEERKKVQ